MLWRKFKLDWRYALGELAIVTLGVLVALAIDQWNDDRISRQEEKVILDRLLVDLDQDAQLFEFFRDRLANKTSSLERLRTVFESASDSPDATAVIQDVIIGAGLGWNQPGTQNLTYQEIVSSGKFGLIRSSILRDNTNPSMGLRILVCSSSSMACSKLACRCSSCASANASWASWPSTRLTA